MFILKHLKTLQHVSIIIQIIFRELVCSLLKSLILKFVKNMKSQCGDAAAKHLVCVRASCVERYAGLHSSIPLHTGRTHTHTKCYAAASPH